MVMIGMMGLQIITIAFCLRVFWILNKRMKKITEANAHLAQMLLALDESYTGIILHLHHINMEHEHHHG